MNVSNKDLLSKIKDSIKNKQPLSIVRCGDGEFHILKNKNDFNKKTSLTHNGAMRNILIRNNVWECKTHVSPTGKQLVCECYQDQQIVTAWINNIRGFISEAIKNADYVGLIIPNEDDQFYGILPHILLRHGINPDSIKPINSLFMRTPEFGSLSSFKNIIQGNDIHIITPNVSEFKKAGIADLLNVNVSYTDISTDRSYKLRDSIKESILKSDKKIFLFGGGSAIKDLIPWSAKTKNAVSIDVGSVLDAWVGLNSRPVYTTLKFKHLEWKK